MRGAFGASVPSKTPWQARLRKLLRAERVAEPRTGAAVEAAGVLRYW